MIYGVCKRNPDKLCQEHSFINGNCEGCMVRQDYEREYEIKHCPAICLICKKLCTAECPVYTKLEQYRADKRRLLDVIP